MLILVNIQISYIINVQSRQEVYIGRRLVIVCIFEYEIPYR